MIPFEDSLCLPRGRGHRNVFAEFSGPFLYRTGDKATVKILVKISRYFRLPFSGARDVFRRFPPRKKKVQRI